MVKTRELFKKSRDIKEIFHAYRHNKGKRWQQKQERWQKYTKELYTKGLNDQIITKVWSLTQIQIPWSMKSSGLQEALLQTKLREAMEFQLSYLKSSKMMLLKCCTQNASKFGNLSNGYRTGKAQFIFQSQRKVMPKNVQTTVQLGSFQVSKKMLKILQTRLQRYVN